MARWIRRCLRRDRHQAGWLARGRAQRTVRVQSERADAGKAAWSPARRCALQGLAAAALERVRRKLAWYSTVTGHCLFVNRQGVRTDEKMLQQLAIDLVHGQAIIIEAEQESMVDRAWKAVMTSLRQLVNRDPTGKPA